MTIESALGSASGRAVTSADARTFGVLGRVALVVGIATATGLYILTQYTEQVSRLMAKLLPAHELGATLLLVGATLPALVVAPVLAFLVELLWVGWPRSSLRSLVTGNRHSMRDALYTVISLLPAQLGVKLIFTFGIIFAAERYVAPHVSWNFLGYLPWWPFQYIGVVLISSFFQYWQHRILHMVPVLWETHKLHHSAVEMNVLNLNRESPFTTGVADLLILVPLAIFGANESFKQAGQLGGIDMAFMALFLAYSVFNVLNHYLIHSEIRSTYGWFGRWIFVSPAAHRVHHSKLPQFWDKNFSVSLIVWDRLFGTWVEGDTEEARSTPLGFSNNPYNERNALIDYFWLPIRDFGRAIAKLSRGELDWIRRAPDSSN